MILEQQLVDDIVTLGIRLDGWKTWKDPDSGETRYCNMLDNKGFPVYPLIFPDQYYFMLKTHDHFNELILKAVQKHRFDFASWNKYLNMNHTYPLYMTTEALIKALANYLRSNP